ncbi:MAG: BamA/TamA family outer membrane protein [Acidobacteria bacterium]|nr:BamA/TamA family outer membrane protein [Acidobacteriota bacterium]
MSLMDLTEELLKRYRDEGYTFARAATKFDDSTGLLQITMDEGRIDAIEFEGVSKDLAERMTEGFLVRPGEIFNRRTVRRAITRLLEPTGGAIMLSPRAESGAAFTSSRDLGRRRESFELVDRNGRRVLVVHLRKRGGALTASFGTEGREDWYSPVDGFAPAIGFGAMVFDPSRFNHTYFGGYVSYKFGPDRPGYSFGLERSLTSRPRVTFGFDLHDLTVSDDFWRLTQNEQSLVAVGYQKTFRDYYRRRGVQIHGTIRPVDGHEVLVAWRRDRHEPLQNTTEYSLFGKDHQTFRPNPLFGESKVGALLLRYTWDSRVARTERLQGAHTRHLVDDLYGSSAGHDPGWRIEWTSEFASEKFGGGTTFRRHILNARSYAALSPLQRLHSRLILGLSDGALLPERTFGLGGIGSVRGHEFKEVTGDKMVLINLEYLIGFNRPFGVSAFFDAGRAYDGRPSAQSNLAAERWLKGVGLGLLFGGGARLDFAWKLDDIPDSLQILLRLSPTF